MLAQIYLLEIWKTSISAALMSVLQGFKTLLLYTNFEVNWKSFFSDAIKPDYGKQMSKIKVNCWGFDWSQMVFTHLATFRQGKKF